MRRRGANATSTGRTGRRALRIGLTGPIGCGKSTVAGWLSGRGVVVVDADAEARAVTEAGGTVLEAVIGRFGETFRGPDGGLDRAAMARLAFEDAAALADLEAIVHPAVRSRILAAVEAAEAAGAPAIVIEAIKLVEGGLAELCDEVWLVSCGPAAQRARLAGRGMAGADAERRIAAQGDLVARLRPHATRVVRTDGREETASRRATQALALALREHAARSGG